MTTSLQKVPALCIVHQHSAGQRCPPLAAARTAGPRASSLCCPLLRSQATAWRRSRRSAAASRLASAAWPTASATTSQPPRRATRQKQARAWRRNPYHSVTGGVAPRDSARTLWSATAACRRRDQRRVPRGGVPVQDQPQRQHQPQRAARCACSGVTMEEQQRSRGARCGTSSHGCGLTLVLPPCSQGVQGGRGEVLQHHLVLQLQGRANHQLPTVRDCSRLLARVARSACRPPSHPQPQRAVLTSSCALTTAPATRRPWAAGPAPQRSHAVPPGTTPCVGALPLPCREIKDKLAPACKKLVFKVQADAAEDYRADAQL